MNIDDIKVSIIKDSRGSDTLEAEMFLGGISVKSSIPSGKSRGAHEAFPLEPAKAIGKFKEIKSKILDKDFGSQEEFDNFLISLDGTENKENLGANLILALSLVFARMMVKTNGVELFQYIYSKFQIPASKFQVRPIFNVINGGAHAKNKLDFQEFQIIPSVEDFGMALSIGQEFYRKLGEKLSNKFGKENVPLGDEAGYSAPFSSNEEAIDCLSELIEEKKYPLNIGLDVAATQFLKDDTYFFNGKKYEKEEMIDYYKKLIETYKIISIEDPFGEEEFDSFALLTKEVAPKLVITDDLTTTNSKRLNIAIEKKSGNAILIKLNQIGTLTETLSVVKMAHENGWQTVVSHRSGETTDDFIADLAVGIGAWGIKSGAPAKPERMAKYERLLEIFNK